MHTDTTTIEPETRTRRGRPVTSSPTTISPTATSPISPNASAGRAVLYLRVSTPGQVHTDYDPEGISLPAQRKACEHKAEQLGLTVVGEYVEAGVSGRGTEHRMEFQKMLARIKNEKDVDYVIVHKLSRLARNRIDEALVMDQFNRRNVTLVSATEPIDNTPEGQFMQGILSAMAQFRSQQDGEDIAYKMGEKAKNGGTIGKAPLGYKNVKATIDGHQVSTVIIDAERAPYIKAMFELYRDGSTLKQVCAELTARGLVMPATRNHPAGPITDGAVSHLLHDPYYLGFVRYKGQLYPGRQEPLISQELFDQVQAIHASRGVTGQRYRLYDHLLKGLLWCGPCHDRGLERRLIMNKSHGKGGIYWHYFCSGRNFETDRHEHAPYIQVKLIEAAVARAYKHIGFSQQFIQAMESEIARTIDELDAANCLARKQAQSHLDELKAQEDKLIRLTLDGTMPEDLTRERLASLRNEQVQAEAALANLQDDDLVQGGENIREILHFLENPATWYNHPLATDESRKQLNAAIFQKIYVYYDQDEKQVQVKDARYTDGIQELKDLERHYQQTGNLTAAITGITSITDNTGNTGNTGNQTQSTFEGLNRTRNYDTTQSLDNTTKTEVNHPDTLEKLNRTRNYGMTQNPDDATKTGEIQDQNLTKTPCLGGMEQGQETPQNRDLTGKISSSESKNSPIGKSDVASSSNSNMVEHRRFELLTSSMPWKRSTK